jgi:hypothetical protein
MLGATPRPKYGPFLWNNEHHRYLWENKVVTGMAELAGLVNAAAKFLRERGNYRLQLLVVEVQNADTLKAETLKLEGEEESEIGKLRSEKAALLAANEELRKLIGKPDEPPKVAPDVRESTEKPAIATGRPSKQKAMRANNRKVAGANCVQGRRPRLPVNPVPVGANGNITS